MDTNSIIVQKSDIESTNKPLRYPYAVFFIFVTEFCERFSYYGMRAVLTLYLRNVLDFSEDLSTTIYHVFLLLCYALPVLGGILADNFIGKYKTIFYISIVYAIGNITLSASSVPPLHLPIVPLTMLGLLLIAIGTGGIKPCVVALGGEQFTLPAQAKQLGQFFAIFSFTVNCGSLISTTITPIFRRDIACFGDETCYPLAFAFPASIMFLAIVVFVAGKKLYKLVPPEGNILVKVIKCSWYAACKKLQDKSPKNGEKNTHWLDYAKNKFDNKLISDTKGAMRILIYYLPAPMFWALYEQLGSRWTFQATRMDGAIGGFTIKPDQMQVANSILMFTMIPVSETIIYPLFRKCGLLKRPLQRMGIGGLFAAFSFVLAGVLELQIENTSFSNIPSSGDTNLNFVNTLSCPLILQSTHDAFDMPDFNPPSKILESTRKLNDEDNQVVILPQQNRIIPSIHPKTTLAFSIEVKNETMSSPNQSCLHNLQLTSTRLNCTEFERGGGGEGNFRTSIISIQNGSLAYTSLPNPDDLSKSKEANAKIRFIFSAWSFGTAKNNAVTNSSTILKKIKLISSSSTKVFPLYSVPNNNVVDGESSGIEVSMTGEVEPENYEIVVMSGSEYRVLNRTINLRNGGSYLLVVTDENNTMISEGSLRSQFIILTPPNEVHMLWLLPQYFVMACAEVLFIISGMEFSFTEAPDSMKSVLQSCWHLANAVGNLIVIFAAQFEINEATGFFTFAILMTVDTIFFAWLASRYKYVNKSNKEKEVLDTDLSSTKRYYETEETCL